MTSFLPVPLRRQGPVSDALIWPNRLLDTDRLDEGLPPSQGHDGFFQRGPI